MSWAGDMRRDEAPGDEGLTLIELLVAMGIFTVVLAVFMSGVVAMTSSTVRAQDVTDSGDSLRRAFQTLDKQIRYASSINSAGTGASGAHYVEFLTTAVPAGEAPVCTQWRFSPSARELAYRTWRDSPSASRTDWRVVSHDVRNATSGADARPPFRLDFARDARVRQQLVVSLDVGRGEAGADALTGADVETVFVARNSSFESPSNADATVDGISDTFVCTNLLERP